MPVLSGGNERSVRRDAECFDSEQTGTATIASCGLGIVGKLDDLGLGFDRKITLAEFDEESRVVETGKEPRTLSIE